MVKIEIYNKKTGKVEEVKDVKNLRGFMMYWAMQCDTTRYGWRTVGKSKLKKVM